MQIMLYIKVTSPLIQNLKQWVLLASILNLDGSTHNLYYLLYWYFTISHGTQFIGTYIFWWFDVICLCLLIHLFFISGILNFVYKMKKMERFFCYQREIYDWEIQHMQGRTTPSDKSRIRSQGMFLLIILQNSLTLFRHKMYFKYNHLCVCCCYYSCIHWTVLLCTK